MSQMSAKEMEHNFRLSKFDSAGRVVERFEADLGQLLEPIGSAEGLDVDGLKHVIGCLMRIFDSKAARESYVAAPQNLRPQLWVNDSLLEDVETHLTLARRYLENLAKVSMANYNTGELLQHLPAVVRRAKLGDFTYLPDDVQAQLETVIAALADDLDVYERRKELEDLEGRAEAAVTKTEAAAEVAAKAAGRTGDDAMSLFYDKLANTESESADTFRKLTVGFALAGGAFALVFVLLPSGLFPALDVAPNDYVRLIQKAIFIAGVFGIAGYFARQAHQHRSMANWAKSLAVQLQTFDAYVAAVESTDVKDELRKSFAARAFGDHPAMKGEPTVTTSAATMDAAAGLLSKLTAGGK